MTDLKKAEELAKFLSASEHPTDQSAVIAMRSLITEVKELREVKQTLSRAEQMLQHKLDNADQFGQRSVVVDKEIIRALLADKERKT